MPRTSQLCSTEHTNILSVFCRHKKSIFFSFLGETAWCTTRGSGLIFHRWWQVPYMTQKNVLMKGTPFSLSHHLQCLNIACKVLFYPESLMLRDSHTASKVPLKTLRIWDPSIYLLRDYLIFFVCENIRKYSYLIETPWRWSPSSGTGCSWRSRPRTRSSAWAGTWAPSVRRLRPWTGPGTPGRWRSPCRTQSRWRSCAHPGSWTWTPGWLGPPTRPGASPERCRWGSPPGRAQEPGASPSGGSQTRPEPSRGGGCR